MDRISIGRVVATRGLHGQVKLLPAARDLARFDSLERVWSDAPGAPDEGWLVTRAFEQKGTIVLELEGVEHVDDAAKLVGHELLVPPEAAVPLEAGEYFVHDLVGLRVVTDAGRDAGVLEKVMVGPGNDIYVVQGPFGEVLVPAVEAFVLQVDLAARTMTIREMPGLFEPEEPV